MSESVAARPRAWGMTSLGTFNVESVLRDLALRATEAGYRPEALQEQTRAWALELQALEVMTRELIEKEPRSRDWTLLLEYEIPRRQRRIDKVVLAGSVILVLEFKIGATAFKRDAKWQAEDYASDLRDYHAASQNYPVIPFLIATGAETPMTRDLDPSALQLVGGEVSLAERILGVVTKLSSVGVPPIDPLAWDAAAYRPTPSVIEATQLLFSHHTVRDLSHAYADNLTGTVKAVVEIVQSAQRKSERVVCFVTGVPGAGKTLAGLVGVHDPSLEHSAEYRKAFLSGNSPLVKVLRAALIQDAVRRGASRQEVQRRVETVVQNVHAFLEEYGVKKPESESIEHVIVFDEAQRAWNAAKLTKRHPDLHVSEPALVLDVMARKRDWSVVIALVGGGQEIHTGEAGLEEHCR